MLTLVSFPSFFSFFVSKEALRCASCALMCEKNEINEERRHQKPGLISLISCDSFISLFVNIKDHADTAVKNHAFGGQFCACFCLPFSGAISKSQPTGCGHTLTRCPLPGWRVAAAPSTPAKAKRQSHENGKP
jgi:hypothetical protein